MTLDNYTSFGSYAPLYIDAKRQISQDRVAFYVLNALADHADKYGICWPGTKPLAALHVKAQMERGKVAIKNPAGLLISIVQKEARENKRSHDD